MQGIFTLESGDPAYFTVVTSTANMPNVSKCTKCVHHPGTLLLKVFEITHSLKTIYCEESFRQLLEDMKESSQDSAEKVRNTIPKAWSALGWPSTKTSQHVAAADRG